MKNVKYRDIDLIKTFVLSDTLKFARYFFHAQYHTKFIVNEHHVQIAEMLDRVIAGEVKKLFINLSPRYGKSELAVKMFIARGLALNPAAKFIHVSSSDELVLDNSRFIQEILLLPEFQQIFDTRLQNQNVKKWYTTARGGLYAVAAAGQVTGFGAGVVDKQEDKTLDEFTDYGIGSFGGAIVVDDPIKPDDALSETLRTKVNKKFDSTIRNRVNSRNTPIIIIGHRLHVDDIFGFLEKKEPGEWTKLSIPAIVSDEHGERALWPMKHTIEELREIQRIDPYVFATQYMQEPYPEGGGKVKKEWFVIVDEGQVKLDSIVWDMWIDGAYTEKTSNDPTGIMICGFDYMNNCVVIRHAESQWMTTPDAVERITSLQKEYGNQASMIYIEPKASGYSFIHLIQKETLYNVTRITGRMVQDGKTARVDYAAPKIQSSRVRLIRGNWNDEFITQLTAFPNYNHDEYCDLIGYAVKQYFG